MNFLIIIFFGIYISQCSVATQSRCGKILNNHFIANFIQSVKVKKKLKSVNKRQKYGQYKV